jgi:hypothetical protein
MTARRLTWYKTWSCSAGHGIHQRPSIGYYLPAALLRPGDRKNTAPFSAQDPAADNSRCLHSEQQMKCFQFGDDLSAQGQKLDGSSHSQIGPGTVRG